MVVPLELVLNETYGVDALIANLVANSKKETRRPNIQLGGLPHFRRSSWRLCIRTVWVRAVDCVDRL